MNKMMNKKVNKKKLIEVLPYWKKVGKLTSEYFGKVHEVQAKMQKKLKNKNLEFFWVDGEIVGIGTPNCPSKMNLIHDSDFFMYDCEKRKCLKK